MKHDLQEERYHLLYLIEETDDEVKETEYAVFEFHQLAIDFGEHIIESEPERYIDYVVRPIPAFFT